MLSRDSSTPRFSRYCAPPLIVSKTDFISDVLMEYLDAMRKGRKNVVIGFAVAVRRQLVTGVHHKTHFHRRYQRAFRLGA